jgi:hypothetical protein
MANEENRPANNKNSKIPSIFYSKKFWISAIGLFFAVLAARGVLIPPDVRSNIIELIMVIVSAYDVGQGIADGVSRGRTSGVAKHMGTIK